MFARVLLVASMLAAVGCVGGQQTGSSQALPTKSSPAPTASPDPATPAPGSRAPSDPDKEQFLAIIRQNAEDPTDLEIVTWEEKHGNERKVTFRCRLVGFAINGGRNIPQGSPVMLEEARVVYNGDKITGVNLWKTLKLWKPR